MTRRRPPRVALAPATALLLVASALAGCTAPAPRSPGLSPEVVEGPPGTGGGQVSNTLPAIPSFNGTLTTADNSGSTTEVFTGQVFEANSEADVAAIAVRASGVVSGNFTHNVTTAEALATGEPASFGPDNFKVWSDTLADGVLWFKFRFTFAVGTTPGTATFTPYVEDLLGQLSGAAAVAGGADLTSVVFFSEIVIAPDPVDADGNPVPGSKWGLWNATAGAANVESLNYVKLTNTGQKPTAEVVLDFTEASFVGASDANFTIPIASNVEFAWFNDATPSTSAPSEGTFNFRPANADGSVTVAFSGLGHIIYVKYRIKSLPAVLPVQSYAASYTATEL